MRFPLSRVPAHLVVLLASLPIIEPATAGAQSASVPSSAPKSASRDTALILSGGVSLGAYEAGVTWTALHNLRAQQSKNPGARDPAMAGASAGAINALIAAVEWCTQAEEGPVTNLFFQTWLSVGLDTLFPAKGATYVDTPPTRDGLFARAALRPAENRLFEAMTSRRYRSCDVPLGVVVSRQDAQTVALAPHETAAATPVQRFAVTMRAQSSPTGLSVTQTRVTSSAVPHALLGMTLRVAPLGQIVEDDTLSALLEAASAFPLAFGPRELDYYCEAGTTVECDGISTDERRHGTFYDGGLFDNIPLGLGTVLADNLQPVVPYVDPDLRRHAQPVDPAHPNAKTRTRPQDAGLAGVDHWIDLAGTFVDVARTHDLQAVALASATPTLHSSTRFAPVVGALLIDMGAFLARDFRLFDYASGLYDGLYTQAELDCGGSVGTPDPACLARSIVTGANSLGLERSSDELDIVYVLRALFRKEIQVGFPSPDGQAVFRLPEVAAWLSAEPPARCPIEAITRTSLDFGDRERTPNPMPTDFAQLQAYVAAVGRCPASTIPAADRALFTDPDGWLARTSLRAIERLEHIEEADRAVLRKHDPQASPTLGEHLWPLPAAVLHFAERLRPPPGFDDSSAIPQGHPFWHLVPYTVGLNVVQGGAEVGWQPAFNLYPAFSINVPLDLGWRRTPAAAAYGRTGALFDLRTGNWILSSIQAGPVVGVRTATPIDVRATFGGQATLGGFYESLSVSGVYERDPLTGAWLVSGLVGLTDLNGLIFWVTRVTDGSSF